jgi:hypothetical protein
MKRIKGAAKKIIWILSTIVLLPPLVLAAIVFGFLAWLFSDGTKPECGYGDGGFYS